MVVIITIIIGCYHQSSCPIYIFDNFPWVGFLLLFQYLQEPPTPREGLKETGVVKANITNSIKYSCGACWQCMQPKQTFSSPNQQQKKHNKKMLINTSPSNVLLLFCRCNALCNAGTVAGNTAKIFSSSSRPNMGDD